MVRPGISLYGGNCQIKESKHYKNVVSLKSKLIQTREINKGDTVGYGATFKARKKMKIVPDIMAKDARGRTSKKANWCKEATVFTFATTREALEASVLRNGFYLVAGVGLMAATGSLHTHACVSVAPMALGDTLDHYRFARDAAVPLLGSTRPGSPGCADCKLAKKY